MFYSFNWPLRNLVALVLHAFNIFAFSRGGSAVLFIAAWVLLLILYRMPTRFYVPIRTR